MMRTPFMRAHFRCAPGGCGAPPGEPCLNYTGRGGRYGKPVSAVHAPRWRKFHAWARGQQPLEDSGRPENHARP